MVENIIQEWCNKRNIRLTQKVSSNMLLFSRLIHEKNQSFNLTGLKAQESILSELVIGSIDPVRDIIVPRGTRIIDIGSGAGIPGIALAIYFQDLAGVLIESNQKKADFLHSVIDKLDLSNIDVLCERAEVVARDKRYRDAFDWCFARAVARHFISIELGSAFIKNNCIFYIYTNDNSLNLPPKLVNHAKRMGLALMTDEQCADAGLPAAGLCFRKESNTPDKYPRRYAVIKREMEVLGLNSNN